MTLKLRLLDTVIAANLTRTFSGRVPSEALPCEPQSGAPFPFDVRAASTVRLSTSPDGASRAPSQASGRRFCPPDRLGEPGAAERLRGVRADAKLHSPDCGGSATTDEVTEVVRAALLTETRQTKTPWVAESRLEVVRNCNSTASLNSLVSAHVGALGAPRSSNSARRQNGSGQIRGA